MSINIKLVAIGRIQNILNNYSMESHMARYAIPEPKIKTLPIVGKDEVFPVRRVYCIGRNYAAHAVEMGHDPDKEDPFFFQKNPDNLN